MPAVAGQSKDSTRPFTHQPQGGKGCWHSTAALPRRCQAPAARAVGGRAVQVGRWRCDSRLRMPLRASSDTRPQRHALLGPQRTLTQASQACSWRCTLVLIDWASAARALPNQQASSMPAQAGQAGARGRVPSRAAGQACSASRRCGSSLALATLATLPAPAPAKHTFSSVQREQQAERQHFGGVGRRQDGERSLGRRL